MLIKNQTKPSSPAGTSNKSEKEGVCGSNLSKNGGKRKLETHREEDCLKLLICRQATELPQWCILLVYAFRLVY